MLRTGTFFHNFEWVNWIPLLSILKKKRSQNYKIRNVAKKFVSILFDPAVDVYPISHLKIAALANINLWRRKNCDQENYFYCVRSSFIQHHHEFLSSIISNTNGIKIIYFIVKHTIFKLTGCARAFGLSDFESKQKLHKDSGKKIPKKHVFFGHFW